MCTHKVPKGFVEFFQRILKVPNVFPKMFSIASHLYSICFAQSCFFSPILDQRKHNLGFHLESIDLCFVEPPKFLYFFFLIFLLFFFFVMDQSK